MGVEQGVAGVDPRGVFVRRPRACRLRWGTLVAALVALAGCGTSSLCDPDQRYENGVCYAPDAPPPTADANPRFAHFGDVCTTEVDCGAPTAFCTKQPGASSGYCTGTGCLADPTVCPAGWGCVDLSVFQAGLPAICTQP
jgi:hypothetical protein